MSICLNEHLLQLLEHKGLEGRKSKGYNWALTKGLLTLTTCACIQLATPADPGALGTRRSHLMRCCWSTMLLTARSTAAVLPMPEQAATRSITIT